MVPPMGLEEICLGCALVRSDVDFCLIGTLEAFKAQGFTQERMIGELNGMGVCAPSGGTWGFTQLRRVLKRLVH